MVITRTQSVTIDFQMVEDCADVATIGSRAFVTASTSVETSDTDAFELASTGEKLAQEG